MSKLKFKEDEYSYRELWKLYVSGKTLFSNGEIEDINTGECFDISNFEIHKSKYIDEILNDMKDLEDDTSTISKKRRFEKNKLRLNELERLYNTEAITTNELRELVNLKYSSKELRDSYSFSSYSFINNSIELPNLSYDELGKFYKLCHYHLTHKSNILLTKSDIRSNPVTNSNLTELFNIKERALLSFLSKLKKEIYN